MKTRTVERLDYRLRVRMLDRIAKVLGAVSSAGTIDDVDGILETARRSTGLSDFGDPSFHEPMRRIVEAASTNHGLSLIHI